MFYQVCKAPRLGRWWGWPATLPCSAAPHEWVALPPATPWHVGAYRPSTGMWPNLPHHSALRAHGWRADFNGIHSSNGLKCERNKKASCPGWQHPVASLQRASPGPCGSEGAGAGIQSSPKARSGRNAAVGAAAKTPAGPHQECQGSGPVTPASARCGLKTGSCPRGSQRSSCCTASAAPP